MLPISGRIVNEPRRTSANCSFNVFSSLSLFLDFNELF